MAGNANHFLSWVKGHPRLVVVILVVLVMISIIGRRLGWW